MCYYYTNQADKALAQLSHSLSIDSKHTKTLLNVGIVKAFGKQDLDGATKAWQQVVELAPDSEDRPPSALSTLHSAHPATGPSLEASGVPARAVRSSRFSSPGRSGDWLAASSPACQGNRRGRQGSGSVQMARDPVCSTYVVPILIAVSDGRQQVSSVRPSRDKYRHRQDGIDPFAPTSRGRPSHVARGYTASNDSNISVRSATTLLMTPKASARDS